MYRIAAPTSFRRAPNSMRLPLRCTVGRYFASSETAASKSCTSCLSRAWASLCPSWTLFTHRMRMARLLAATRYRFGLQTEENSYGRLCVANGGLERSPELKLLETMLEPSKKKADELLETGDIHAIIDNLREFMAPNILLNQLIARGKDYPHISEEEVVVAGVKCVYIRKRGQHPKFAELDKDSAMEGCFVCLHGGGYLAGGAHQSDAMMAFLVNCLDIPCLSVEYTRPPESIDMAKTEATDSGFLHIDECTNVVKWLHSTLGVPLSKTVLIGDSAGGGLVLALVNHFHNARVFGNGDQSLNVGLAIAVSPWVDLCYGNEQPIGSYSYDSFVENRDLDPWLSPLKIMRIWAYVCAFGSDAKHCAQMTEEQLLEKMSVPLLSPIYGSYKGCRTRVLVTCSQYESLRDHGVQMHGKLLDEGVSSELRVNPTNLHNLPRLNQIPEHMPELVHIASFVKNNLSKK